jgi:SAM-dependent methyltransferase/nicotinamide mononucleotide adenylyltransferase
MIALLLGRFHALTLPQHQLLLSIAQEVGVRRIVCVVTSADHAGTRRNPLDAATREELLRPALAATGKPFALVRVADIPDDARWVEHVRARVLADAGEALAPEETLVVTANRDVDALFAAAGYRLAPRALPGLTPHELIELIVAGKPWQEHAAPSTIEVYARHDVPARLRAIFRQALRSDDGELAARRDFASYGAQMDASLAQKLEDLLPWVLPGTIVDKGCGTGKLLVELSRRFPESSLVGVDLSRELLRRSDENTYAGGDVQLVLGDAAEAQLPDASADTVIFSSIMHEIYSYGGYQRGRITQALTSAARELRPGGRVLIRDGVSPDPARWRLALLDDETRARFTRFAREFKHGQGAHFERLAGGDLLLNAHEVNEFLCKKDYVVNWDIEVHEEYGVLTVAEWRQALADAGFAVLEARAYVNEWIAEHRYRGRATVADEAGGALPWPATNVVVVGERRGGGA